VIGRINKTYQQSKQIMQERIQALVYETKKSRCEEDSECKILTFEKASHDSLEFSFRQANNVP